ncbi:two-component regulator propeller domain-containing protein [Flammeovirga sp. SJP92]|uniref:ligand-binding sensor domain-containing protein n=1 Tax=Flammeovirga sp. SJP92 TaxID=1775430 RepID=UPI000786F630|nr:two-component regulator propeller domain-containing protein [Flammeovirga sp. SJP92]KXX71290.1 hypothetical protein AVL50_09550 [Flammeovirga sp. SJP92]
MRLLLLFLLFNAFVTSVFANKTPIEFRHLSIKDGLISNYVNTIYEDANGLIWLGTNGGLSKYDGYNFQSFTNSTSDTATLSNNMVTVLAEDKHDNLWIGTQEGLNKLDLTTYKITRVALEKEDDIPLMVTAILIDAQQNIWVGTYGNGLYCLDAQFNLIKHYVHDKNNPSSIISNQIQSLLEHPQWGIMVGSIKGLEILSSSSNANNYIFLQGSSINSLTLKEDASVLIAVNHDYDEYYLLSSDFIIEEEKIPFGLKGNTSILQIDSEGNRWLGVRDVGVVLRKKNGEINTLRYNKYQKRGINSNTITSWLEDQYGNIWLGTLDAGVNIFDKNRKPFNTIDDNYLDNGLRNNRVRSMYQDSEGEIWIGTKVGGTLSRFDANTHTFEHYEANKNDKNSLSNDYIFCITEDKPGFLWVGTLDGLNYFDKKKGTFKSYRPDPNNPNSLKSESIYALLKEQDDLYIGHAHHGLDIYNTITKKFVNYQNGANENTLSDNRVKQVFKDSRNEIWVGTMKGLNLFDSQKGTFKRFLNSTSDTTSISGNIIQSIYEDENQNLWIGTSLGLNKYDPETNSFISYTKKNGLAGNSIKGVLGD